MMIHPQAHQGHLHFHPRHHQILFQGLAGSDDMVCDMALLSYLSLVAALPYIASAVSKEQTRPPHSKLNQGWR